MYELQSELVLNLYVLNLVLFNKNKKIPIKIAKNTKTKIIIDSIDNTAISDTVYRGGGGLTNPNQNDLR